jgi:hypothetical protein
LSCTFLREPRLCHFYESAPRLCILPPCFLLIQLNLWIPKVCRRAIQSSRWNLGNLWDYGFLFMNFIHICQNFTSWHVVLFETWHVLHFCTDDFPHVSRVRRWRYNLYQQVALGGFSTPCVGSAQCRWLHHSTDLRGVRAWALRRSPLEGDRHCATTPGPRRLVWLEFHLLGVLLPRVCRVSRSSGIDGLLWPQPHSGGSLSVWVVSSCESSRPGVAGSHGSRLGATFASRAVGHHSDAGTLPQRCVHTLRTMLQHRRSDRSAIGGS